MFHTTASPLNDSDGSGAERLPHQEDRDDDVDGDAGREVSIAAAACS
jgi:hypothetical protein